MAIEQTIVAVPATPAAPASAAQVRYLEWGPVLAGAIAASAVSFLLLTFGGAIGLSLTSPWPNTGFSSVVVGIVIAIWTALVQIAAFTGGGYLAGRMRSRWGDSATEEGRFRDGAHGFLVWAVGVVIGALLLASATGAGLRVAAQSAATVGAGAAAGAAGATAGTMTPTGSPYDLALDVLFRPATQPTAPATQARAPAGASNAPADTPAGAQPAQGSPAASAPGASQVTAAPRSPDDSAAFRAETGRLFGEVIRKRELSAADREYLAGEIARRNNISRQDAEKRVDAAVMQARDIEIRTREQADRARRAAVLAGFLAAASLLISCAAACFGAAKGGQDRDDGAPPMFAGRRFW